MFLDALLAGPQETRTRTVHGYHPSSPLFEGLWGTGSASSAGEMVDETTAATVSAVYAAVRLVSWTRAVLSLCAYERTGENDRKARKDLPIYGILHQRPNPDQTAFVFHAQQSAYELLWGNSVAWIETTRGGQVGALWPLDASKVGFGRFADRTLAYDVSRIQDRPTKAEILTGAEVLHVPNVVIPGGAMPGVVGRSVIDHARESLGEQIAAQKFGGGFFAGGSLYALALKLKGRAGDPERLRKNLETVHGTGRRRIPVLEDEAELQQFGMPLKDAQFVEQRQGLYIQDVARWFGCPPHLLADLSRATFSNIAEQQLNWYQHLLPWLTVVAQEYSWKLFTEAERRKLFVEHLVDTLLKGDIQKRFVAYSTALKDGWMSRNEVRAKENLNSMGKPGDVYTVQAGVANIESLLDPPEPEGADGEDGPDDGSDESTEESRSKPRASSPSSCHPVQPSPDAIGAARRALGVAVSRMIHKECLDVRQAAAKPGEFLGFLDRYYRTWMDRLEVALRPAAEACRSLGVEIDTDELAFRHCDEARRSLLALSGEATAADLAKRVDALCEEWETTLAANLVDRFLK